ILLTPWLLEHYGPRWAFGVPAVLMFVAVIVFWSGRYKFAHIPPGGKSFLRDSFSREGWAALGRLAIIYVFVAVFWSLWDQSGAGLKPNIGWQLPAFALLSAGEVMVSITALEFSYTQAPKAMKSIVMALYLLSISAGNAFTALVHWFIQNPDGSLKMTGPAYYY